jgi:hypothetical protein
MSILGRGVDGAASYYADNESPKRGSTSSRSGHPGHPAPFETLTPGYVNDGLSCTSSSMLFAGMIGFGM